MDKSKKKVPHWSSRTGVEKFKLLVIAYLCIRSCLVLFLQGQYIWMQSNYQSNPTTFEFRQVEEHRLLMRKCGITFRDWGATTMLAFSTCLACLAIFILGDKLTNGLISSKYQADSFIMFYRNSQIASAKLNGAFDNYLRWMILLNNKKLHAILNNLRPSVPHKSQNYQLIADLNGQQVQLRLLLDDRSSIWPSNRTVEWRQEQKRFLLHAYTYIYTPTYCLVLLVTLLGSWYTSEQHLYLGETPPYIMERMGFIEIYVSSYVGFEKYSIPMIMLVVQLRDKRLFWSSIQSRFKTLRAKLAELRIASDFCQRSPDDCRCRQDRLEIVAMRHRLDSLRSECDAEALRIYLSLRVFLDELKPTTELASTIAKQYCSMALIMLLLTLPFFTSTTLLQILANCSILLATVSIINIAFLVCALLESGCIKTTQHAWSLVASLTRDPSQPVQMRTISKRSQSQQQALNSSFYRGEYFSLGAPCSSLINEHTTILWRRFLEDMPIMHRNFRCEIFDVVSLNYSGMMRLNFWFISVVLVFLSHKQFQ